MFTKNNLKTNAVSEAVAKILEAELDEGSGPKEKQKTPYRNINSTEYKAAADKQKEKMKKDDASEPGKKLLGRQHKLDKNHNGKLDAHDFKLLRGEKPVEEAALGVPLKGHEYHKKTDAELRYIQKDAAEAAKAMKFHAPRSEAKYLDQVNDASTVLHYRSKGGKQLAKESVEPIDEGNITHILSKELVSDHKRWMDSEGFDTKTKPLPKSHPKHATHVGIVSKDNKESSYHEDGFARPIHESVELDEADHLTMRGLHTANPQSIPSYMRSTEKGKKSLADKNRPILKQIIKGQLGKHPKPNLPEEVEELDELSKDTLMSYIKKADKQQGKNFDDVVAANKNNDQPKANKANAKYINRERGQDRAVSKMYAKYDKPKTKRVLQFEGLDEDLKGDMHPDADKVLKHIKPEHHGIYKPFLKKGMYKGNYADRAAVLSSAEKAGHALTEKKDSGSLETFTDNNMGEMSDAQMKDREHIVKSMKKGLAGFKERYGKRAKDVMYATATKQAMKDESVDPEVKTTDTLAGRVKGGTPNLHTSYKVKLKTEAMGCENTPMSRATNLAKAAYKKLKNETMMGKAGGTSEEKE